MNYIKEIKAFYDLVQVKQLSTGQIALWHALMQVNNKCAWIEWFTAPNLTLELTSGLSRKGIYKARNILKQYGAIDFKTNGTKATSYKLISLLNSTQVSTQDNDTLQDSTQGSTQGSTQDSTQGSTQDSATLNKLNETKQKSSAPTNSDTEKNDLVEEFFESVWSLYPSKKGKGKVSDTKKKDLYKLGDEIKRCISRYAEYVKSERARGFKDLKYQNGSTFFNSGYVDYLDTNYLEKEKIEERPPLKLVIRDNY